MSEQRRRGFEVVPFPKARRSALDAGRLGRRRHIVHGLLEADVTRARHLLREHKASTGEALSFTAFVVGCLAKAVEAHREVQTIRGWWNRLVVFDDVNVNVMIEVDEGGRKVPMPYVVRDANRKTFREIHDEIRAAQAQPRETLGSTYVRWFLRWPGFLRQLFYLVVTRSPTLVRKYSSSVMVTAVGMFGHGGGWGIPVANFPLTVTLGGIAEKPGVVEGRIEVREYLCVTLSFDHDLIDGAPAARFTQMFRESVESGLGLATDHEEPNVCKE